MGGNYVSFKVTVTFNLCHSWAAKVPVWLVLPVYKCQSKCFKITLWYFPKFYKLSIKYIHGHFDLLLELDVPQRKNIPFFPNVHIYLKALSDHFAYFFFNVPQALLFLTLWNDLRVINDIEEEQSNSAVGEKAQSVP